MGQVIRPALFFSLNLVWHAECNMHFAIQREMWDDVVETIRFVCCQIMHGRPLL